MVQIHIALNYPVAVGALAHLSYEILLHTISCPGRYSSTEEIGILRPNWARQYHCTCQNRPVIRIAFTDTLECLWLRSTIDRNIHLLNYSGHTIQH